MKPSFTALLCAAAAARAAGAGPQLTLYACDAAQPPVALAWRYSGSAAAAGALVLNATGQCVTFDPSTTNLVTAPCAASADQQFLIRADGTIYSPSRAQCWDSQYYGNASGSGLGLYDCEAAQRWDLWAFDAASGRIFYNATAGLCVNGGSPPPPLPTPQQLAWTQKEVSLMISFDIVTSLTEVPNPQHFCIQAGGDADFPVPPAARFAPSDADFTQSWVAAARAAEAGYTLLVASHCSGFFQWQSNVLLPNGSAYPYTVAQSNWKGGKGDVVDDYIRNSKAAGLGTGLYLTWNYNYLFNWGPSGFSKQALQPGQINVTEAEYRAMMLAQMAEVWGRYPNELTEIWCVRRSSIELWLPTFLSLHSPILSPPFLHHKRFDGGENNDGMNALIKNLQPQAIAADGTAPPNYARLVGQESGFAPYPVWSTNDSDGSGDPSGAIFCPAEADTPVAEKDGWFWKPGQTYRPLQELYSVYKNTVGANSLLELGVLPDNTGSIPADQMAVLQGLGDYIRSCHSPQAAAAASNGTGAALSFTFPKTFINRVILQEDQSKGQLVQAFKVEVRVAGGYAPKPVLVAEGTAIGNKRILYFSSGGILAEGITVTATALYPGYTEANWLNVAVYTPCELEQ